MHTQAVSLTRSRLQEYDKALSHPRSLSQQSCLFFVFVFSRSLFVLASSLPRSSGLGQTRGADTPIDGDRVQLASMAAAKGADVQGALI